MIFDLKKYNIMGVINITPNSFSDGGKLTDKHKTLTHVENLQKNGVDIFDFGAESTAPFNDAISEQEELKRFDELFFSWFEEFDCTDSIISFDTYRPYVFQTLYHKVKAVKPYAKIIWNDVSGILDSELVETLNKCPEAMYVFSHANVESRDKTSDHMKYIVDCPADEIIAELESYFIKGLKFFNDKNLIGRVILDPCFGFSKSYDQNMFLLKNLSYLGQGSLANYPWLVGASKKSFLRKSCLDLPEIGEFEQAEFYHFSLIQKWLKECDFSSLSFRLHDPNIYHMAKNSTLLGL
jgi:dihydropteroate synthase